MIFKNTRRYQRAESKRQVTVSCETRSVDGTMLNISLSGLFAACADLLDVGTTVQVEFQLPESSQKLTVSGRVVRAVSENLPQRGIGIEFIDLPGEAVKIISAYVARCQVSQR